MFANRFTALVDACVLTGVLKRNLILSLAAADFFRVRWSVHILDEAQAAICDIRIRAGSRDPQTDAQRARSGMEDAFPDACVTAYEGTLSIPDLPDVEDLHVIAAAVKTQAAVIVTDNTKHFPSPILERYGLFARTADEFIADAVDLDLPKSLAVIETMRGRLQRPEMTRDALLLRMEATDLPATADLLRPHLLAYPA